MRQKIPTLESAKDGRGRKVDDSQLCAIITFLIPCAEEIPFYGSFNFFMGN